METKYLDSQLKGYRLLDEQGKLPDNGKDQLKELEAIKQALNIDLVSERVSIDLIDWDDNGDWGTALNLNGKRIDNHSGGFIESTLKKVLTRLGYKVTVNVR